MVIKKFNKKTIIISLSLIVLGFMISLIGFNIAKFDLSNFKETDSHKWYRTIQIDENSFSFSINF